MIKILILSHYFYPDVGGIETNSEILATAFCKYNAEVHLITWTNYKGERRFPFVVIRNPSLNELLKEHKWADVIFENNPSLRLSWPNMFIRKPLVIAVNTWIIRLTGNKGIKDKLKNLWFHRANYVIAVSNAVRKKEWKDAVVIENPYNNHLFKNIGIERTVKFVFLGRLVSDKGADQAILAMSALVNDGILNRDVIQLTIIGDGPEKQNLQSLIKMLRLERAVQLIGVLTGKKLADCLNLHEFILVPSSWEEPYGNVVLEGMACGCIPIASDGGGLPEAVGNAGFTFKRNNSDAFINSLKNILYDLHETEAKRAKIAAHLATHTVEIVAEKYFRILKEAVNPG